MSTQTVFVTDLNERSLADRPWVQPEYKFRPRTQHDEDGHSFRAARPFFGWTDVRVDSIDLTMFTNNDDGVAGVYHAFGPDAYESASVAAWLEIARSSRQIVDVGSFTGLYAMLAQKVSPDAKVLAVEPNGAARARLMMNLVVNGFYSRLGVVPYAISGQTGVMSLHIGLGADLLDTGGSIVGSSVATTRTETIAAISLDGLMQQEGLNRLDLVKIDVEGAEVIALKGAEATLAQRPTILLEIQSPTLLAECYVLLSQHGYCMMVVDDETAVLTPYDGSDAAAWMERHVGYRVMNFLCAARTEHVDLAERGLVRIRSLMAD